MISGPVRPAGVSQMF